MMYLFTLYLAVAIAPVMSAVVKNEVQTTGCSIFQFSCSNGECISLDKLCDGRPDCVDGLDESVCEPGGNSSLDLGDMSRNKRQSACRKNQWQCRDGNCIPFYGKCDGLVDCPDGSDETHARCRNTACQENLFRCTYGACVDGTAPCNGEQECADNSDELLPRCLNETRTVGNKYRCDNGEEIGVTELCDGLPDCKDGSDENIKACAGQTCSGFLFQCAYGACVDQGSDCDGKQDCADNSDESDELCNRTSTIITPRPTTPSQGSGACVLPQYPSNGRYEVVGDPFLQPGSRFDGALSINMLCNPGFAVNGMAESLRLVCGDIKPLPICERYCELRPHHSVEYTCVTRIGVSSTTRPCGPKEFSGTTVVPTCRRPNYRGSPGYMNCVNGAWNYIAKCSAECGRTTPEGKEYIINGTRAKHGAIPWQAGIYRKTSTPYKQICGGSLVSIKHIITAAHCFWDDVEGQRPAHIYAAALGKIYRPWSDDNDRHAQYSNISEIHIPDHFRGAANNFQYDIAIVVLETEIEYQVFIRPVCLSLEVTFNRRQLQPGMLGKVSGWGLNSANGRPSQVLQVVELPYVNYDTCFNESPPEFREYISGDKFCAGFLNGTALCEGDSGGGLAFPANEASVERYFLRGIVSTAPSNDQKCDPNARTTFTEIMKHEHFIKSLVNIDN